MLTRHIASIPANSLCWTISGWNGGGTGTGDLWIWQDGSQHTNQEGEDMRWQEGTGLPAVPGELGILFEDGDSMLFEDGDTAWWED